MSNPTIRIAPNFGYMFSCAIEVFLQLCDDSESDIRMFAEECLNRIIRVTILNLFDSVIIIGTCLGDE